MKKLILLSTLMALFTASPIFGQSARYDATEQSKRLARKNNHITKTYNGEVVKMLYRGLNSYGGVLTGFVFRKEDGKLLKVSVPTYFGAEIGPHLMTSGDIEITVTGDALLLEEIFSKRLATRRIEVQLKEEISGLADIKGIKTSKGSFSVNKAKENGRSVARYLATDEPVLNAKVLKRINLRDREGILVLDNGDSLIFYKTGDLVDIWDQNYVSYLRPDKKNSYNFYQNPNVYSMSARVSSAAYLWDLGRPNTVGRLLRDTNPFLKSKEVTFVDLLNDPAGYVHGMVATNELSKLDTFWFNRTDAKAFHNVLKEAKNEKIKIHFQQFPGQGFIRVISHNGKTVTGKDRGWFRGEKDDYLSEKMTFKGKISDIQYLGERVTPYLEEKAITPFRNIILEDSIFIRVTNVVALSIAQQIEKGKEISFDGWKRKELPTQINQKGYTFMMPHKITIDGVTFTNHSMLSNSQ